MAAADNDDSNNSLKPHYLSDHNSPNVISVGATDNTDKLAAFSNYGVGSADLAAPGANVYSTLPGNKFGWMSGTSMAAPEVSGAAALICSLRPNTLPVQVKSILLSIETTLPLSLTKLQTANVWI